ncbi:hypothetical protein [Pseudogracilibacillus auburnensis]|nr:hypothetical protein [Pseudogracilibacillus auburnensis]MBO1002336.1 hypothetical protein [Pseudogracilibacillus auburnensis]
MIQLKQKLETLLSKAKENGAITFTDLDHHESLHMEHWYASVSIIKLRS